MLSDISLTNWREADDRSRRAAGHPARPDRADRRHALHAGADLRRRLRLAARAPRCSSASPPRSAPRSRWGCQQALSDDGSLTGRGESVTRGAITGVATFVGGTAHALPFLIGDLSTALKVAYVVVAIELTVIAWVRKRFLHVSMRTSLIQVTLGGIVIAAVGVLLGHA